MIKQTMINTAKALEHLLVNAPTQDETLMKEAQEQLAVAMEKALQAVKE